MNFLNWLASIPSIAAVCGALVLIPVVVWLDYATGEKLSFSIFYMPIVLVVSMKANLRLAAVTSFVSVAVWAVVNFGVDNSSLFGLTPLWNSAVRFSYFFLFAALVSRLKALLAKEKEAARTDFLTGLENNLAFAEFAQRELERSRRYGFAISIALIDCDNFKCVNDSHGHAEGDRALEVIGKVLLSGMRKTDFAARLGGDEFAILLPQTPRDAVAAVIERLREELLHHMNRNKWPITFSIGVLSLATPPESLGEMLRKADKLMYSVKHKGKDAVAYGIANE